MMINLLHVLINHDLKLYARKGGEQITVIGFFLISLTLFPFALGAENPHIQTFAPAFIWIVALLASLLSLPVIFHRDQADGSLDQLRLSGVALEWCVLAKCAANWLGCMLPVLLLSPVAGLVLGMEEKQIARLMLSLLVGTPVLSCIGALGGAFTLHAVNKGGLLAVLVLPLYIPTLIFSTLIAMSDPLVSVSTFPEFFLLLGIMLGGMPLSCWFSAWVLQLQD